MSYVIGGGEGARVGFAVRYAFGALGPHRLEAGVQPGNAASLRLVRWLGFHEEGCSPPARPVSCSPTVTGATTNAGPSRAR